MPSEAQAKEELIISAPNQPKDSAQPEDNAEDEDNDQQGQNLRPVHPRVANEVQIEKITGSTNAPGPLTRSRATCYLLSTVLDFPEEERMMQQSSVSISLSF